MKAASLALRGNEDARVRPEASARVPVRDVPAPDDKEQPAPPADTCPLSVSIAAVRARLVNALAGRPFRR
jgi:hypothetical protein